MSRKKQTPAIYPEADSRPRTPSKVSEPRAAYGVAATATAEILPFPPPLDWSMRKSPPRKNEAATHLPRSFAGIPASLDVVKFAFEHALLPYIERAVQLMRECFPHVQTIKLAHEVDWDIAGESWLALNIEIPSGDADETFEAYMRFNQRMTEELPPDKSAKILLGLAILPQ